MSLRRVLEKTWRRDILFSALVELTYRCNLDCFFCYNDLGLRGRALDDDQYRRLFDDLAAMQVMNLTLTGGEPLSHPSFLALGRHARARGFVLRIKSNGHALRGRLLRAIRNEVDPFLIEISLHGADAATHDRQTRIPGSFERLLSNLGELRAVGQRVKLNATLTRWNEHQIEEIFALVDRLELPLSITPTVTPRDDGDLSPLSVAPSRDGVRRLYELLDARCPETSSPDASSLDAAPGTCTGDSPPIRDRAGDRTAVDGTQKNCGAGSAGIAVDPFGTVFPCVQWRRPLGSLHEQSIREIWESSPAVAEVRALNRRAMELRAERGAASHCMGLSEEKTGDPLAIDPDAAATSEVLHEVQRDVRARRAALLPVLQ